MISLSGSVIYFQAQVDALRDTLGQYATQEASKAAVSAIQSVQIAEAKAIRGLEKVEVAAIDGLQDAEAQALEAVGLRQKAAEQAIATAKASAIATVSDAHGIAGNMQAVLRLDDYLKRRWCDRTEARQLGETYRNTTGLPLEIAVTVGILRNARRDRICQARVVVDKSPVLDDRAAESRMGRSNFNEDNPFCATTVTIPPNATYAVEGSASVVAWYELSSSLCNEQ